MSGIRIACTAIAKRIMAGRVAKDGMSFIGEPKDMTSDCLRAVIEFKEIQSMTTPNAAVTLEIGGAKLTVDTHDLFRAWLDKHIGAAPAAPAPTPFSPVLKDGEHYAGIILGKDGTASHHLILLPGEAEDVKWQAALDWAASTGGELPSRREQSLLFANLKEQFSQNWYWSSEQHSGGSDYAWGQSFSNGSQFSVLKGNCFRARAVRRILIIQ